MFTRIGYQCYYYGSSEKKYKQLRWINDEIPISIYIQKTNSPQEKVNFLVLTEAKDLFFCSINKEFDPSKDGYEQITGTEVARNISDAMFVENYIIVLYNNTVTVRGIDSPKIPILVYHFNQKVLKLSSANGFGFAIVQHFNI